MFAQETTRQNAHTTSSISEHQVAVICEGKHWNVKCDGLMRRPDYEVMEVPVPVIKSRTIHVAQKPSEEFTQTQ
jgi:hypothetical protein